MPGGQLHHRRLQPRPERGRIDLLGQPGAGPRATAPTARLVRAVLGHDHADRRRLADLVATEPPDPPALPIIEPSSTSATRIRVVINDLIHLILGPQLTTRTPMPGLPTSLALSLVPPHQFLRLRARLRTPWRPRLRWSLRRRLGTRARVLASLLLQPPQPILMLRKPAREIENELDTRLTPRVIDRLPLRSVHAGKIRCTNKESLPQAPTERLPKRADLQVKCHSHHYRARYVQPSRAGGVDG
jgi:hypothetical protein